MVKRAKAAQEIQMMFAPGRNVVEVVAGGNGCASHKKQNLGQRIHDPPRFALILNLRKMLQQQRQSRPRHLFIHQQIGNGGHRLLPGESSPAGNHKPRVNSKSHQIPANLSSEPWRVHFIAGLFIQTYVISEKINAFTQVYIYDFELQEAEGDLRG